MDRASIQALIDAAADGRYPPQPPGAPILRHQAGRPVVSIPYGVHELDGPLFISNRVDVTLNGAVLLLLAGVMAFHVTASAWAARIREFCAFVKSQDPVAHGITRPVTLWWTPTLMQVVLDADANGWVPCCADRIRVNGTAWRRIEGVAPYPLIGTRTGYIVTLDAIPPQSAGCTSWQSVPAVLVEGHGTQIDDALIRFAGKGIEVHSGPSALPDAVQTSNVHVFNCDTGVHLRGGDTNGGRFDGTIVHSGRIGILDESFLGNSWVGTLLHTLSEWAYRCTVPANYSTHVGTYVEADCGSALATPGVSPPDGFKKTIDDQANVTWLGGGAAAIAKVGTRVGLNRSRIRFGDTMPNGDELNVTIPHASAESALTAERKSKSSGALIDGFRLAWTSTLKACGFVIYPDAANANGLTRPLGWTTEGHGSGFGHARVNALPPSQGNPAGYEIPKP